MKLTGKQILFLFIIAMIVIACIWYFMKINAKPAHASTDFVCNEEWCHPTPTPFHYTCNEDHACVRVSGKGQDRCESREDCEPNPSPKPSPTATPSATPTPKPCSGNCGTPPTFLDTSYHVQVCNGIFPNKPLLQGFKALGNGSVEYSWWGVSADKYSMRYGYDLNNLMYGIPYIPNTSTSITINGLQPGKNVWAVLTAYKGECAIDSDPLDPKVK